MRCFFVNGRSRKRRPSFTQQQQPETNDHYMLSMCHHSDPMNECNAALVLMSLSGSPHSSAALHHSTAAMGVMGSSPGGSSTSSWTSESSSLSDEYAASSSVLSSSRFRTTSLSMSDEGIGMDYGDETPRKRRVSLSLLYHNFLTK